MIHGKDILVTAEWEHEGKKCRLSIKIPAEEFLDCETLNVYSPDDDKKPRFNVNILFKTIKSELKSQKKGNDMEV